MIEKFVFLNLQGSSCSVLLFCERTLLDRSIAPYFTVVWLKDTRNAATAKPAEPSSSPATTLSFRSL